jgi:heme-degrading monooxygenase HmoA
MILVVFRSRIRTDHIDEIIAMDGEMKELVRTMPGFIDYKEYGAEDGEVLNIAMFQDAVSLRAWRDHPRHREAMALGYDRWMSSYDIAVCEVNRRYTRDDRTDAMARGQLPGMDL